MYSSVRHIDWEKQAKDNVSWRGVYTEIIVRKIRKEDKRKEKKNETQVVQPLCYNEMYLNLGHKMWLVQTAAFSVRKCVELVTSHTACQSIRFGSSHSLHIAPLICFKIVSRMSTLALFQCSLSVEKNDVFSPILFSILSFSKKNYPCTPVFYLFLIFFNPSTPVLSLYLSKFFLSSHSNTLSTSF